MRPLSAVLVFVATSVAVQGCNAILDNEEHDLAQDAQGGTGPGTTGPGGIGGFGGNPGQGGIAGIAGIAGLGGFAGIAGLGGLGGVGGVGGVGTGGTTGGSGGADAGGGKGGTSGAGGSGGSGGTIDRDALLDNGGSGGTISRDSSVGDTTSEPPPGSDGGIQDSPYDAADACVPNSTECRDRSVYLCTPGGQWVEILQCPNACVTGACTGSCVPGTMQCVGTTPQTCDNSGKWQSGSVCPFVCTQGACTGMCVPGNTIACGDPTTCNDGAVQTCDTTGTLGPCLPAPSTCATVPAGWDAVAMGTSGGSGSMCPSGFEWPQTFYTSATAGPYTCTCGCAGTQNCAGNATLYHSTDNASCAGGMPTSSVYLDISTSCYAGGFGNIVAGHFYNLGGVDYGARPACSENPFPTNQPPVVTQTKTLCWPSQTCPSGACLSSSQSANMCVYKLGTNTCPAGYPNSTILAPYYDDTRTCGACTCESALNCTFSGVVLNNDSTCAGGHPYMMTATTACTAAPTNYPLNAVQATGTSTGDPSCVEKTPSSPSGNVQLPPSAIATVCCK